MFVQIKRKCVAIYKTKAYIYSIKSALLNMSSTFEDKKVISLYFLNRNKEYLLNEDLELVRQKMGQESTKSSIAESQENSNSLFSKRGFIQLFSKIKTSILAKCFEGKTKRT